MGGDIGQTGNHFRSVGSQALRLKTIAVWNAQGEVRRIDLKAGLNVITGESQTGKSALIEIIEYCLGSTELHVPMGPISETVVYYGLLLDLDGTSAFVGRPALSIGQQSTTSAQLEIGSDALPASEDLLPNTTTSDLRDWLGRGIGIAENRFDPPEGQTRPSLVASLSHALLHCFQRQDEIASRQVLFHKQADPFVAQSIRDTLPYFLGVTGPEQLRQATQLRDYRRDLAVAERQRDAAAALRDSGLQEALGLISEANNAGLTDVVDPPQSISGALAILSAVRDAPAPPSPAQAPGTEFDRLQRERHRLVEELSEIRQRSTLVSAISQSGDAVTDESTEQIVRLQTLDLLGPGHDSPTCPVCEQTLEVQPPSVYEMRAALTRLDDQISAVERDRPGLVQIGDELRQRRRAVRVALDANRNALDQLAAGAEAVEAHQARLDLGSWVRGRVDHYLETVTVATESSTSDLGDRISNLRTQIADLEAQLDPVRIREAATSVLVGVGREMTSMATSLGLEHADLGVRVDIGRLTVVADSSTGPIYMSTGIGSGKNWVGYHLATALSLQQHFTRQSRPVPRFLVLDQPTQAFFPSDQAADDADDQDRQDALAQFELMRDVVGELDEQLQILVLDHADFRDSPWFQDAVVERWRGGTALIPEEWIQSES